ncbi:MAG: RNA methyltransferase [Candidatus Magasanikbacteria bacterium]|jgi:RNA methyltransferase, TrmH family|nr:RNA methyltransferase [Candidatus Magasanikbacteria bacterium]MBT5263076.1 RNA methyltransferase [Candidatus Magasanikbacteria bacterium]MBT5819889.1 RNA methyltransferase [Candidatus Magasanikbacteria bacterium]MBT6294253.1 RNA methyltransferase [Candidatus Magasanikbacteria bacterium]
MLTQSVKTHIHKLHQKKYRYGFGEYIVEGKKGVEEAIKSNKTVALVVVQEDMVKNKDILPLLHKIEDEHLPVHVCSEEDAQRIKTTATFSGIMALVKIDTQSLESFDTTKPIICLDRIQDPGNLGTIIRTADWFGVHNILVSESCVDVYNDKVVRSTMGSLFHTTIVRSVDVVNDVLRLKTVESYGVAGLTLDGGPISKESQEKTIFIFGNESHGIRATFDPMLDYRYTIAGSGKAESLNVGVAAGIILYSITQ